MALNGLDIPTDEQVTRKLKEMASAATYRCKEEDIDKVSGVFCSTVIRDILKISSL